MDLSDFLTWRATGCASRSLCAAVCKWTYQACTVPGSDKKHGWQDSIWTRIGLDEITRDDYRIIGQEVLPPGAPCGSGLSTEVAMELGLEKGTPVATSIIDGHAGGLGLLGCEADGKFPEEFSRRLAIIAGTSAAHMLGYIERRYAAFRDTPRHRPLVLLSTSRVTQQQMKTDMSLDGHNNFYQRAEHFDRLCDQSTLFFFPFGTDPVEPGGDGEGWGRVIAGLLSSWAVKQAV
ncbi:hypothetical protein HPB51_020096 [Rhipicephalus microplus]|uniref:Uncharacterized protein n=1 Tax=Rhipicephalus microplus TaxID=6941 RepID=A0A9J6EQ07_RHIMP|nr:hypothetical protein HPB51_020096 [Rhipicephalus microplus]